MLVLCNPHNPTGRVFTRAELEELAEIALAHDMTVVSDEIHAELVYAPHVHVPFASLSDEVAARTITLTSATKAFNLAAVRCAVVHFGHAGVRDAFDAAPLHLYGAVSPFGVFATEAAFHQGRVGVEYLFQAFPRLLSQSGPFDHSDACGVERCCGLLDERCEHGLPRVSQKRTLCPIP